MKNWHAGTRYRSDWRKKTREAMAKKWATSHRRRGMKKTQAKLCLKRWTLPTFVHILKYF
jgi:hypothetical protein